ncbi:hypothetical protein HYDPIDRAFT_28910 [Hydnomerulius pinastri MD-312]|uniref:Beta-lactamase-related domain-containing protein n=1 Tax=Hydnomerulius pinastri MD-312 TaxID=994086 RepID=A0A0C9WEL3_9AGAM|nr:hypothetical protein HYDPIDRAFT_28910 [Hydnomerulius pinastri MD-312]
MAEDAPKAITPTLSTFIEETMAASKITGLSLAVIRKNGAPEYRTWGKGTEEGDEMAPDTLFHVGSVSKAFCATALGLLIDDFANGKNVVALPSGLTELTWHTRVKDLLPEDWQLMDEWASERATIRNILSHVSGVARHDYSYGPLDTPYDVVKRLRYLKPASELREQWSYINIMYIVATHIVSTYAGKPYTTFKAEESGKFTQGWTGDGQRRPGLFTESTALLGAGPASLISSAADMSKWVSMWINQGAAPMEIKRSSRSRSTRRSPILTRFALVILLMATTPSLGTGRGDSVVPHPGGIPGSSAIVSFLPSDELGIVVLANAGDQSLTVGKISDRILDQALRLESLSTQSSFNFPFPGGAAEPEPWSFELSLDEFAGTHTHPGYRALTLCSPTSPSSCCVKVQADFAAVNKGQNSSQPSPELIAAWPRVWSSHIRMRYLKGSTFKVEFVTLFPNGHGKDSTPFETTEIIGRFGNAEFIVEDGKVVGFGISGLLRHQMGRGQSSKTVQERADVWFDRV